MTRPVLRGSLFGAVVALLFGSTWFLASAARASGSPPVANDDDVITLQDTPIAVLVLLNDSDPEGDPLTVEVDTQPAHGTATANPDGTITYAPAPGYTGPDAFDYKLCDNTPQCDTATVTITVQPAAPGTPQAVDDVATTEPNVAVTVDVLANDTDPEGDPLTVASVTPPVNGTATLNADSSVTYTPALNFIGTDSFTYDACDPVPLCDTAAVTIHVLLPGANPPTAADDQASTEKGQAVTIDVLANDTDPDGDPLVATNLGPAGNGTATPNADGTISYQPEPDFTGLDSFTYEACDPTPLCDAATVTITVSPKDGGGGGGGGGGGDDEDGTQVAGDAVEDETIAFTGPSTAPLLSVTGLLALLGFALIAAGRRIDDPSRRLLGFEPLDGGGFVIR